MSPSTDQGINQKKYQVIPRVLVFLFNNLNQVLLLKGAPDKKLWANLYNGVGGHIEAGEDILEAAERELIEETGLSDVPLSFCAQIMIDVSEETGVSIFVFKGECNSKQFNPSSEGELSWVSLDKLSELPVVEDLPVLISQIEKHTPTSQVVIMKYGYEPDGKLRISIR